MLLFFSLNCLSGRIDGLTNIVHLRVVVLLKLKMIKMTNVFFFAFGCFQIPTQSFFMHTREIIRNKALGNVINDYECDRVYYFLYFSVSRDCLNLSNKECIKDT